MKRIVIMGPPGAGKGTQGDRLANYLDVPHIASGDLLRRILAEEPESALARAAVVINSGRMVSDELAAEIVLTHLRDTDGFVLDGYPRNIAQAQLMDRFLRGEKMGLDAVISLNLSEDLLVERLMGRLTCIHCGESYHQTHRPPLNEGVCDRCHHALEVRPDDHPKEIRTRFRLYQERTKPLLTWYGDAGLLRQVDASHAPDVVFAGCLAALRSGQNAL